MAPPVSKPGRPPDVTAQTVTKETDVTDALKGSREMTARNAPLVSKVMNVNIALRDSKEMIVENAPLTTMEMTVVRLFSPQIFVIDGTDVFSSLLISYSQKKIV